MGIVLNKKVVEDIMSNKETKVLVKKLFQAVGHKKN
jgi:hypothetical protein